MNLGMSREYLVGGLMFARFSHLITAGFQHQDFKHLTFPSKMYVDYVRVYQREDAGDEKLTCDPSSHPTAEYITKYVSSVSYLCNITNRRSPVQPSKRVLEPQSYDVGPSRVHVPAQLQVRRMLSAIHVVCAIFFLHILLCRHHRILRPCTISYAFMYVYTYTGHHVVYIISSAPHP